MTLDLFTQHSDFTNSTYKIVSTNLKNYIFIKTSDYQQIFVNQY